MKEAAYIHGTDSDEQARLALLNRLTNAAFVEFLALRETDRVLEVGSGLGLLTAEVAARVPRGAAWGAEFAREQLARARESQPNLRFVQADAHALPWAADSFDVVYCRYVLEHVARPEAVLAEMRRVVRRGGRVCAQENNILVLVLDPPCPRFDFIWRGFAALQARLGGDALIGRRLFSLFKRAGFGAVELSIQPEIHAAGQPTFRPWLENLIGNVRGGAMALQAHGLASADNITEAIAELRAFIERRDASTIFYWNRAQGVK